MNLITSIPTYIRDSKKELKKVIWPSRKETIKHTLMVIGVSLGTAFFLGILDIVLQLGFEQII